MSDRDSFIDEVTEEVRRDRLFSLFRRWGWLGLLIVVLIVGGAAWNEWRNAREMAAAQALGDRMLVALEQSDAAGRRDALAEITAEGPAGAMAALLEADAALESGDTEAALAALDRVAADTALPTAYRDLALLKSVIARSGGMSPEARLEALQPLMVPGAPYRLLAEEQAALAEIEAGQRDDALARLRALADDTAASAGLRRRVAQLIVALGADPSAS